MALEQKASTTELEIALLGENLIALSQQRRLPSPHISLESLEQTLESDIVAEARTLLNSRILVVAALYRLDVILLRTALLREQLRVYRNERELLVTGEASSDASSYVGAVCIRQPRMQSFKRRITKRGEKLVKKQKAQLEYEVACITGAVTTFAPLGPVAVSFNLLEDTRAKTLRNSTVAVELVSAEWKGSVAHVAVLFPDGTQVVPSAVSFAFGGRVTLPSGVVLNAPVLPQPRHVRPLVVCTNENQWEHAEGRLVHRELFGPEHNDSSDEPNRAHVSWPRFCNVLSEFAMRATRQDLMELWCIPSDQLDALPEPRRALSDADFAHISKMNFGGSTDQVSEAAFEAFWTWFGAVCHHYRHNLAVRTLYLSGMIYGLIAEHECNDSVLPEDGMFLFRNSDTSKQHGEFFIALRHNGTIVQHRVDPQKVRSPYGNLADYVRDKAELTMLVKPFHERLGCTIRQRVGEEKSKALAQYYSTPKDDEDGNGDGPLYDDDE